MKIIALIINNNNLMMLKFGLMYIVSEDIFLHH